MKHTAYKPADYSPEDAAALQALQKGVANAAQQQRALDWIVLQACRTYDFAFRPGANDRDTNIALGRQFVGQQIVKLLNIKIGILTRRQQE